MPCAMTPVADLGTFSLLFERHRCVSIKRPHGRVQCTFPKVIREEWPDVESLTMRIDLFSLQLFIALCEEKSIGKVAEREHIAASAVSKRMSDLEARLNAPLFRRSAKGLTPTAAAESLLHHAHVITRDVAQMELELGGFASGVTGQVRLTASVSTIIQHLPGDLRAFLAQHAGIRVDIEERISQDVIDAVAENAADIGVFGGAVPRQGLRIMPYRVDRLAVILPIGHVMGERTSVSFADISTYDLIGSTKGSFLDSLMLRAAADLGRPPKIPVRVNGFETVCHMVEAQLGIGLVPEACAMRYADAGKSVTIVLDEPWAIRQWKLCVRDGPLPAPVRLLLDHLAEGSSPE